MPNMTYAAQGNLTIYRLRNGDTFTVSFDLNGKPLYQGIDPETGTIKPDWTVAAGNPCRVLHAISDEDKRLLFRDEEIDDEAWERIVAFHKL